MAREGMTGARAPTSADVKDFWMLPALSSGCGA